ncbi:MAG: sigma-54 dependent transcriptional regulator [Planctomycetaceae bacterium]
MSEPAVLICDDEASICWAMQRALTEEGYHATVAASAEEALERVRTHPPDVIMMDVRLPGLDGLTALQRISETVPGTPVIIMTAFGNLQTAVRAINQGAFEYLTKPFNLDDVMAVVGRALESRSSAIDRPADTTDTEGSSIGGCQQLLGKSPAMQAVFRQIALVAEQTVPVLITGESGTGKELVAQAIHYFGRSSTGPFVPICVPAMSDSLVESELFGHSRGAFTGADSNRTGLLEMSDGGTAFLDEIGDISPATQVKLLRVLESRVVTPVGSADQRHVNFRLIAATNRDLEQMVNGGQFRQDLFFRLNVFRIELPPLRHRPGDISLLAQHFVSEMCVSDSRALSAAMIQSLEQRPWFGNVRELRNAIEHAVILARGGELLPEYLPPSTPGGSLAEAVAAGNSLSAAVDDWWQQQFKTVRDQAELKDLYTDFLAVVEPILLQHALQATGGNRQEAARLLGMHRQTFREKLKRMDTDYQ